jgi:NADH:ubiquinone oxidoreductase subunit K
VTASNFDMDITRTFYVFVLGVVNVLFQTIQLMLFMSVILMLDHWKVLSVLLCEPSARGGFIFALCSVKVCDLCSLQEM